LQGVHAADGAGPLAVPAGHAVQLFRPTGLTLPAGQAKQAPEGGEAPVLPAGQSWQSARAESGPEEVPAGHHGHSPRAGSSPNLPAGQEPQPVEPTPAYLPGGQGRQAVALTSVLYLPTVQLRQPYSTVHVQV
jgi:hypothetical protein